MGNVEDSEFAQLLEQVQHGSQEAGWSLVESYGPAILRVVRSRLSLKMRSKFDSIDFVQAVWKSFFSRSIHLQTFEGPDQLVAHLATLARNKVIDECRRRLVTKKHEVSRERSIYRQESGKPINISSSDPTPSEVAIARERWTALMADQPEHYKKILQLRYEGETYQAIANQLGLHERTVRRAVRSILHHSY